jgi:hypothetical protein
LPGCADHAEVAIAGHFRTRSVAFKDDRNFLLTILRAAQPRDLGGIVAGKVPPVRMRCAGRGRLNRRDP